MINWYSGIPEGMKKIIRPGFYFFGKVKLWIFSLLWKTGNIDYHEIPIIINNFNRLTYLKLLIEALEKRNYRNIHIIDNNSTYEPLLAYYGTCTYPVYRLNNNLGYLALWTSGIYKKFFRDYYVYTDGDVVPIDECTEDFLDLFRKKLRQDKDIVKIGLSLKIDDLPDCYQLKNVVLEHEKVYYLVKESDKFYVANVDTTFALYRPGYKGGANLYQKMLRSAWPYQARHMPWYIDSEQRDEEEIFYLKSVQKSTHWSSLSKQTIL